MFPSEEEIKDWLEYMVDVIAKAVESKTRMPRIISISELSACGGYVGLRQNQLAALIREDMGDHEAWVIYDALDQYENSLHGELVQMKYSLTINHSYYIETAKKLNDKYFWWAAN